MRKQKKAAHVTSKELSRELKKIGEAFAIGILEDAIRTGNLNAKEADHIGLSKHLEKVINEQIRRRKPIFTVIDHTESILKEARSFSQSEQAELAILLYATWIEHFINRLIEGAARKKGLQDEEIHDLIRDSPLKGKISWLRHLLELPSIPLSKRRLINQIMETRNGFVHYKWKYNDIDDNSQDEKLEKLLKSTEGLVRYLKSYEKRNVLPFSNRKLKNLLDLGMRELGQMPSVVSE